MKFSALTIDNVSTLVPKLHRYQTQKIDWIKSGHKKSLKYEGVQEISYFRLIYRPVQGAIERFINTERGVLMQCDTSNFSLFDNSL